MSINKSWSVGTQHKNQTTLVEGCFQYSQYVNAWHCDLWKKERKKEQAGKEEEDHRSSLIRRASGADIDRIVSNIVLINGGFDTIHNSRDEEAKVPRTHDRTATWWWYQMAQTICYWDPIIPPDRSIWFPAPHHLWAPQLSPTAAPTSQQPPQLID